MLTTKHEIGMSDVGKIDRTTKRLIMKPIYILDYNKNMEGVDKVDMLLSQ